ncbi:hypothetical protein GCM10022222_54280 [Amycolatopsis ultiminotia]|uniref:Uncharacterized protein n=1 Tax=Amycolatopsis ultiminotia TaxID=543629 RepID=A0ABP6X9G5_9PSEU
MIINVATDLKTNVWAWLAVGVLVGAGAVTGWAAERRSPPAPGSPSRAAPVAEAVNQANYAEHGVQVHVGGSSEQITVKSRSGTAGVTLGVLVIVATLAGMAAGAWLIPRAEPAAAGPTGSGAAAPAWAMTMQPEQCDTGWVVPDHGQSSIPVPDSGGPEGAVLTSGGRVEVTFQGVRDEAAVLHSISVEVVRRAPALPGIYLPGLCGSDVRPHFYATDLDAPRPVVVPAAGEEGGVSVPARQFSFQVGKSDVEKAIVVPNVAKGSVEWYLHVKWSSGNSQGDLRIGDGDRPFRTTAATAAKKWCTQYPADGSAVWGKPDGATPCA